MKPTGRKCRLAKKIKEVKEVKLGNTERSQMHRMNIYGDNNLHEKRKQYDREQKRVKRLQERKERMESSVSKRDIRFTGRRKS